MRHKGPVLRPRCIGPGRAQTRLLFYSNGERICFLMFQSNTTRDNVTFTSKLDLIYATSPYENWFWNTIISRSTCTVVNPLMPNNLYVHHAVSPLNSQMTYIYVSNSVPKFGGILFTPIQLTAVACYASGPLKVRLSFRSQNVPPPPPKPLHKHRYTHRHSVTVRFSQLTNMVLTLLALIIACLEFTEGWNINTGLWSKNSFMTRKVVSSTLYPYNSDKNRRYPQISMFTATGGPTDLPLVVLG